jgi:tetratricopeptide (TPR) repeat protein
MHELWLHLSTMLARQRCWGEAQEEAAVAYLAWSDRGTYLNQLAYVASIRGEDEAALRLYEEAAIAAPDAPEPYIALAFHWSAVGELEKSYQALQCGLRRAPRYADLHHQMGLLQRGRHRPEESLEAFRSALEINPEYALARLDEADTLFQLERWSEAHEAYLKVLDTGLGSSDIHLHLGQLEQRLGHREEAERAFLEALRLNPAEALAHYHLGKLYRESGDRPRAQRAWKRFLSMNPDPEREAEVRAALAEGPDGATGGKP